MAEDPQPLTLQQRIAALNASHVGRVPGAAPPVVRSKPQLPGPRPPLVKHNSINIPQEQVNGTVADTGVGNQPNGPPQLPARKQAPPLPNRNGPDNTSRRPSVASTASTATTTTTDTNGSRLTATRTKSDDSSRVKAPAWGDVDLPPLPPKSIPVQKSNAQIPERPKYGSRTPSYGQNKLVQKFTKQTLPPPLPTRKASVGPGEQTDDASVRKLPPVPTATSIEQARKLAFSNGPTNSEVSSNTQNVQQKSSFSLPFKPPISLGRPIPTPDFKMEPPPIPLASRPDLSAIQATKPKFNPNATATTTAPSYASPNGCMTCRDFSGPDNHAARFPRQSISSLPDLAHQLTAPFGSLTDKARAIFTWLHYNISYDVVSFFNNCVQKSTPQLTLQSGLAVCEGYAALFANLATHAGLEALVISGHGKGFGYTALATGEPLPPYQSNHAWNAVKIDNNEWKLLDACWGAGHVQGKGKPYKPHFTPKWFTMSNEEFGIKHLPTNKNQLFLPGGRIMSWEEYIQINPDKWPYDCEPPTVYSNAKEDYTIGEKTMLPRDRKIGVNSSGIVRFQFGLFCEHWTLDKHSKKGLPPVFILAVHGVDGRKDDYVPLEHRRGQTPGGGGDIWYVDIPARELGAPGQTLMIFAITTFGNRQNARGLSVREFREAKSKGRTMMQSSGIAAWDLV